MGRPTEYRPEFCEMLIAHMAEGGSYESFGAKVNCGKRVLYDWEDAHPDFLQAKETGRAKGQHWWETQARTALNARFFQTGVWAMSMRNMFGWSDRERLFIEGGDKPIKIQHLSDAEKAYLGDVENSNAIAKP